MIDDMFPVAYHSPSSCCNSCQVFPGVSLFWLWGWLCQVWWDSHFWTWQLGGRSVESWVSPLDDATFQGKCRLRSTNNATWTWLACFAIYWCLLYPFWIVWMFCWMPSPAAWWCTTCQCNVKVGARLDALYVVCQGRQQVLTKNWHSNKRKEI